MGKGSSSKSPASSINATSLNPPTALIIRLKESSLADRFESNVVDGMRQLLAA